MPDARGTNAGGGSGRALRHRRPVFRNIGIAQLGGYRLPLAGVVSILHRISGMLLFLIGIPLVLYLFQLSLSSPVTYARFEAVADNAFVKLVLLALFWAFFHHLCAGIRYLALDLHIGLDKEPARMTAIATLGASLVLTLFAAVRLFGSWS